MMWLGLALIVAVGIWTYGRVWWVRGRPVSHAWRVEDDRRQWSHGIDQVKVARWPIEK